MARRPSVRNAMREAREYASMLYASGATEQRSSPLYASYSRALDVWVQRSADFANYFGGNDSAHLVALLAGFAAKWELSVRAAAAWKPPRAAAPEPAFVLDFLSEAVSAARRSLVLVGKVPGAALHARDVAGNESLRTFWNHPQLWAGRAAHAARVNGDAVNLSVPQSNRRQISERRGSVIFAQGEWWPADKAFGNWNWWCIRADSEEATPLWQLDRRSNPTGVEAVLRALPAMMQPDQSGWTAEYAESLLETVLELPKMGPIPTGCVPDVLRIAADRATEERGAETPDRLLAYAVELLT